MHIFKKSKMLFLFEELDSRENADLSSFFVEDSGRPVSFKRLVLPGESGPDLFKYKRIWSGSDTLICSEVFKASGG